MNHAMGHQAGLIRATTRKVPDHPVDYCCPIGGDLMHDPVSVKGANQKHVYERANIARVMADFGKLRKPAVSPMTRELYVSREFEVAKRHFDEISKYTEAHPEFGHRMRSAEARTPQQTCLALHQFAERCDAWHVRGDDALVKRLRPASITAASVLAPALCFATGAKTISHNFIVNGSVGLALYAVTLSCLYLSRDRRAKSCQKQEACITGLRSTIESQKLSPCVRTCIEEQIALGLAAVRPPVNPARGLQWIVVGVAYGALVGSLAMDLFNASKPSIPLMMVICYALFFGLVLLSTLPESFGPTAGGFSWSNPGVRVPVGELSEDYFPADALAAFGPPRQSLDVDALDAFVET